MSRHGYRRFDASVGLTKMCASSKILHGSAGGTCVTG